MKKFLLFSTVLAFAACAEKKTEVTAKNTDLIQQNLKGNVETLEETTVSVDSTGAMKGDSTMTRLSFDSKGYQTSLIMTDSAGKTDEEQVFKHTPSGLYSEIVITKNGKPSKRMVIEEKDGIYTTAKTYDSTGKQDGYYTELKTNENGIVYAGKEHFMDGRVKSTFDMKYDGPNFLGGTSTDSTGKKTFEGTVTLDKDGNASKEIIMTPGKDSSMETKNYTYKYEGADAKGNWTLKTSMDDKGKTTRIVRRKITYFKD